MADKLKGFIEHNENVNKQIKAYLQEAMILLIEQKKFDEITITELCAKAGVSRMAFYGNYKSKEDLFGQIVRTINKDMIEFVGNPFTRTTGEDWYINFFTVMQENAHTVKTVCGADQSMYLEAINSAILFSRPLSNEQKYMRLIWTGGMVNATRYWLETNMSVPLEVIARYCYHSLDSAISDYPAV